MATEKSFRAYKKYWEDQASFMDKLPWPKQKILKLTISDDCENDDFQLKVINLLGIQKYWLTTISLDSSFCRHHS
tara:strand:- start:3812 stop:4036 length:225 start_codon:yes stop_codon:yes gene_type:complete